MAKSRVVIIGGGVVGVCSAYYLALEGWNVTLLERQDICAGCSYGNAGMIVPSHAIPLAAPGVWVKGLKWMLNPVSAFYIKPRPSLDLMRWLWEFRGACNAKHVRRSVPVLRDLSYASLSLFQRLAAIDGFDFGYAQSGMLMVFRTKHGYEEAIQEAGILKEAGVTLRILDRAAAREVEPTLAEDIVGGIFFADDASVIPDVFVKGLARIAASIGVDIRTATEVLGFRTEGNRVVAIETTRGDVEPDQVVLAAGAWTPILAAELRLRLPIQSGKGYSATYHRPATSPRLPIILGEARAGVTPMGRALRFAGTMELAGLDLSIQRRRLNAVVESVKHYMRLPELRIIEVWCGLRPLTPDGLPILGRPRSFKNLILATGHAMLGLSLGPVTGKLVSQFVGGQKPVVDVAALTPDRFA